MAGSKTRTQSWTIWIGGLVLTLSFSQAAFLGGPPAPAIRGIAIHGNEVTVSLAGAGGAGARATVTVRAITADGPVDLAASVFVPGGGTAAATMAAPAPVVGALPLGVVLDDGVPF